MTQAENEEHATTNQPLSTVARQVGFANASHLALHFKRLLGVTPTTYRARP